MRTVAGDEPVVQVSLTMAEAIPEDAQEGFIVRTTKAIVLAGLASSMGEATRKQLENAISINGEKSKEKLLHGVKVGDYVDLRLGKKSVKVEWVP